MDTADTPLDPGQPRRTKATLLAAGAAALALAGGLAAANGGAASAAPSPSTSTSSGAATGQDTETKDGTTGHDSETKDGTEQGDIVGSVRAPESKTELSEADEAKALAPLATISQSQAENAAQAAVSGSSLVSTTLENEDGYVVYEVLVKDAAGVQSEVIVDAGNGTVLHTEKSDGENEAAEPADPAGQSPDTQPDATTGNGSGTTQPDATTGNGAGSATG